MADAVELAASLTSDRADWRDAPVAGEEAAGVKLVSFSNKASLDMIGRPEPVEMKAFIPLGPTRPASARSLADLNLFPVRARDAQSLSGLASYSARGFQFAEDQQRELDCLAKAVYYEARSESSRGQLAVAEVVMNRVGDSRFPKTVCDVVFQGQDRDTGCQFTFTCDGSLHVKPYGAAWDRARAVALNVTLGLNKPVTGKATHYHTDYVNPYWAAGLVETAEVGTHIFYRFPKTGTEWRNARLALNAQDERRGGLVADAESLAKASLITVSAAKPEEIASAEAPRAL